MSTEPRELRHARTPVVRSQIRGLRAAVQHGAALASNAPENDRIGHALAANMNAGFALGHKLINGIPFWRCRDSSSLKGAADEHASL